MRLEQTILRHLWPHAPQSKIVAVCSASEHLFREHGIDDWDVVVHLMANISAENGDGTIVRESGNYRADRIVEVFGPGNSSAKVTPEEAQSLAHNPQALFNRVYGDPVRSPKLTRELGNIHPGDGYKYRGGGDLQLTGRGNYEHIGKLTGHPEIIENPDLLADPTISFTVAVAEFAALGCIALARKGLTDPIITAVRRKVNGGTNGLAAVRVNVHKWAEALPQVEAPAIVPRGADTKTDENKGLMSSKIMQGATGTAASVGTAALAKVAENANTETTTVSVSSIADKVQSAADTVTTVSAAKDSAMVVVQTVKPFLGVAPNTWAIVAMVALGVAVVAIGYTLWERYAKKRDSGL